MPSGRRIDVNSDMGEIPALLADGTQERLLQYVASANISCGAHAGDPNTIEQTIRAAMTHDVKIGAHPGYPDRANFGRLSMALTPRELESTILAQLKEFEGIAKRCGAMITHVKPHGALYNSAVLDREIAETIAAAIRSWRPGIPVMGLAGSQMLEAFRSGGLTPLAEGFADRAYEADGTLRSRSLPGANIHSPEAAAAQALRLAQSGTVDSICIHSDAQGAVEIAAAVRAALKHAGF